MRLSFDDEESFKESVGSLNFNRSSSDSDSLQEVPVGSSMPSQERNEDVHFDKLSESLASDPNIILEVRRVPVGSSSTGSASPQERSEDT